MKKFVSIRSKLVSNIMLLISIAFVILLSVVTTSNILSVNKNIEKSKIYIRNSLITKGKTLAKNNSMAMRSMAEDNAFTAIQALVSSTVADDEDMVYGIYMDNSAMPWVFADADNPSGIPKENTPLTDAQTQWALSLKEPAFRELATNATTIIEFAAPVGSNDDILGFIRYGISTSSMRQSIIEAQKAGAATRNQTILIIIAMGIISLTIGFIVINQMAGRITSPIASLVNSSKIIAAGSYDVTVHAESNDEIGDLATHFDGMRVTIKRYTDHLQDLIDEKMQQVNDILNNIDQGLFTINLDGTVNQEYSARANSILRVPDVASCTIKDLLRFDAYQENAFLEWLELVQKKHAHLRWKKLARLAPVQTLELVTQPDINEIEYVSISYQKIYDQRGNLSKIMVLALDETESRLKDMQMATERQHHENDVRAILSIANTPAEEMDEFTEDTATRLMELHTEVTAHLEKVNFQRDNHPESHPYQITNDQINRLYRNLHTIKGNGGSYGFDMLSYYAHCAEDELEKLRLPINERRGMILGHLNEHLLKMDTALDEISQKIRLIFGKGEEITVSIPEARISSIVNLSRQIQPMITDDNVSKLVADCLTLSWKPLKTLLRKHQKAAFKIANKVNKKIAFTVDDENVLYPAESLSVFDDVLMHLIRNAVDHGIEDPETRNELGKGVGHIHVTLTTTNDMHTLTISDDGKGIDTDQLVEKGIAKDVISREESLQLSSEQKIQLLFRGGISTSETLSDISGRGMGMQIIYHRIAEQLHGTISIDSTIGKGTTFTIRIPVKKDYKN